MHDQLNLNENGIETIDEQTPIQQIHVTNGYLDIPIELYFNFAESTMCGLRLIRFLANTYTFHFKLGFKSQLYACTPPKMRFTPK